MRTRTRYRERRVWRRLGKLVPHQLGFVRLGNMGLESTVAPKAEAVRSWDSCRTRLLGLSYRPDENTMGILTAIVEVVVVADDGRGREEVQIGEATLS